MAAPYISNGTTMVPVRGVCERLGAEIGWNAQTSTVTAALDGVNIEIVVGSQIATVNGENQDMKLAPIERHGRVYIPLRFVATALGAEVAWDEDKYRVDIRSD